MTAAAIATITATVLVNAVSVITTAAAAAAAAAATAASDITTAAAATTTTAAAVATALKCAATAAAVLPLSHLMVESNWIRSAKTLNSRHTFFKS